MKVYVVFEPKLTKIYYIKIDSYSFLIGYK